MGSEARLKRLGLDHLQGDELMAALRKPSPAYEAAVAKAEQARSAQATLPPSTPPSPPAALKP